MKIFLMIYLIFGVAMYIYAIIGTYLLKNGSGKDLKWYYKILGCIVGVHILITWAPIIIAGGIVYEIRYRKELKKLHKDIEETLKDLPELE